MKSEQSAKEPMYRAVGRSIRLKIEGGSYGPGQRLPSDAELATEFETSRLTIIRSLRELEARGLVQRKPGSGTFVRSETSSGTRTFGLLVPDLGDGEVFEPICRGIARAGELLHHTLLWGSAPESVQDKEQQAAELCRYFIARKVAGVFFAPLELSPGRDHVNRKVAAELESAGIPLVLIDRAIAPFPERSTHDMAGIDNVSAGYRMTTHLLRSGCKRVAFGFRPGSAPTVDARMAGYRLALRKAGIRGKRGLVFPYDPSNARELDDFLKSSEPDGIVCANDLTAAKLMHHALRLGIRIPEDLRMVGINDVKYARFLPVPLTTLHQPCQEIGAAALNTMLERLARPNAPARDVLLDCELVIRQSCGGGEASGEAMTETPVGANASR